MIKGGSEKKKKSSHGGHDVRGVILVKHGLRPASVIDQWLHVWNLSSCEPLSPLASMSSTPVARERNPTNATHANSRAIL